MILVTKLVFSGIVVVEVVAEEIIVADVADKVTFISFILPVMS